MKEFKDWLHGLQSKTHAFDTRVSEVKKFLGYKALGTLATMLAVYQGSTSDNSVRRKGGGSSRKSYPNLSNTRTWSIVWIAIFLRNFEKYNLIQPPTCLWTYLFAPFKIQYCIKDTVFKMIIYTWVKLYFKYQTKWFSSKISSQWLFSSQFFLSGWIAIQKHSSMYKSIWMH